MPGLNSLCTRGRWAFAEVTETCYIEADLKPRIEAEIGRVVARVAQATVLPVS